MGRVLERDVVNAARKHAQAKRLMSIRMYFGPGVNTGWPDEMFLIPGGRPLFIEFKAPGKKPSPKQGARIGYLRKIGYDVEVCDTPESARDAIDRALEAARLSSQGE